MKQYIQNNIEFRIVSSNSIASFKASQAFDFNEVVRNKANFGSAAREELLLEYDHWFRFLMRVEKLFLFLEENEHPEMLTSQLEGNAKYLMDEVEDVLLSHETLFDNNIISFVKYFHGFTLPVIVFFIRHQLAHESIYKAFPYIVDIISTYLQLLLFSLFEFDHNLVEHQEPFLSYTKVCEKVIAAGICVNPIVERAKFYKNKFGIDSFVLKNHVKNSLYLNECLIKCKEAGINIVRIEEMF